MLGSLLALAEGDMLHKIAVVAAIVALGVVAPVEVETDARRSHRGEVLWP